MGSLVESFSLSPFGGGGGASVQTQSPVEFYADARRTFFFSVKPRMAFFPTMNCLLEFIVSGNVQAVVGAEFGGCGIFMQGCQDLPDIAWNVGAA